MSIWDAGGEDTISAVGASDWALIQLEEQNSQVPAGGEISNVNDVVGGFTIANGVVIENAIGSDYADSIQGNSYTNKLEGEGGDDLFMVVVAPITFGVEREPIRFYLVRTTSIPTAFLTVSLRTLKLALIILHPFTLRVTSRTNSLIFFTTSHQKVSGVRMHLMAPPSRFEISTTVKRRAQ